MELHEFNTLSESVMRKLKYVRIEADPRGKWFAYVHPIKKWCPTAFTKLDNDGIPYIEFYNNTNIGMGVVLKCVPLKLQDDMEMLIRYSQYVEILGEYTKACKKAKFIN